MSNTIKEVLQLHWMDGAKLSGGSYHGEPSLNAEEAMAEIERLLEGSKPESRELGASEFPLTNSMNNGYNHALSDYHQNIKKVLGIDKPNN